VADPAPGGPSGSVPRCAREAIPSPSLRARTADGLATASTAVAEPSARAWRSSPRRAWSGPSAPPSRRWTKPRTGGSRPRRRAMGCALAIGWCSAPGHGRQRRAAPRPVRRRSPATRRQQGMEHGQSESREDRSRTKVRLDPLHDRGQC
jgi:hypothetical protein